MPHRAHVTLTIALAALLASGLAGCAKQTSETPGQPEVLAAPTTAVDPAQREGCFANEQAVETQVTAFQAQSPGTAAPADLAGMVAQGMLRSAPTCPAGGSYSYDASQSRLTCSVHGHY